MEGDPGSIRFLLGHAVMQLSLAVVNSNTDVVEIDTEVLYLDAMASHYTEGDEKFEAEMAKAVKERRSKPGEGDQADDLQFRLKQFRAIIRCLCRKGIITKMERQAEDYIPESMKPKVKP